MRQMKKKLVKLTVGGNVKEYVINDSLIIGGVYCEKERDDIKAEVLNRVIKEWALDNGLDLNIYELADGKCLIDPSKLQIKISDLK